MEIEQFATRMDAESCKQLYASIASILQIRGDRAEFIGSHPVSLCSSNIHFLFDSDYLVCEKTDGIRVMLLSHEKILYFYDRKNVFYRTRYAVTSASTFLFDGELYQEGEAYVFAIFDSLISADVSLINLSLLDRLKSALSFTTWLHKGPGHLCISSRSSLLKFGITTKQMSKSHGFCQVLDAIPGLKHMNDGLIFTPVDDRYAIDTRSRILKWKPPYMNTVDFLIKKSIYPKAYDLFSSISSYQLHGSRQAARGHRSGVDVKFATFYCPSEDEGMDGRIGEFLYDENKEVLDYSDYSVVKGGWSLYKIRSDKNNPNNIKVVLGLLDSIRDNIGEDDLRSYHKKIYENYLSRKSGCRAGQGGKA